MELYKVVILSVLLVTGSVIIEGNLRTIRRAQSLSGELHYERRGLSPIGALGRVQSGLHSIAGGIREVLHSKREKVHNTLQAARDRIHSLVPMFSVSFDTKVGATHAEGTLTNIKNGGSQKTGDDYPHYEVPDQNQHITPSISDEAVVMYLKDNFPVILLKQNEIRR